jgi:hypothetical protein
MDIVFDYTLKDNAKNIHETMHKYLYVKMFKVTNYRLTNFITLISYSCEITLI